ncbi:MAG: hypothetical protein AAF799_18340 [Myxococcota bacterium]
MIFKSNPLMLALSAAMVLPATGCLDGEEPGDELELRTAPNLLGTPDCDCPTCNLPRSCWAIRDLTIGISLLPIHLPIGPGDAAEAGFGASEIGAETPADLLVTLDVSPVNYVTLTVPAEDVDFDGERHRVIVDLSEGMLHPTFGKAMAMPLKNLDSETVETIAADIETTASMALSGAGQGSEFHVPWHEELWFIE